MVVKQRGSSRDPQDISVTGYIVLGSLSALEEGCKAGIAARTWRPSQCAYSSKSHHVSKMCPSSLWGYFYSLSPSQSTGLVYSGVRSGDIQRASASRLDPLGCGHQGVRSVPRLVVCDTPGEIVPLSLVDMTPLKQGEGAV